MNGRRSLSTADFSILPISGNAHCYNRMVPFTRIVGVLNVTPDSYYDGGQAATLDAAVARVGAMLDEGADIIEVGGESTGPGSTDITLEEELQRTMPVLEALRERFPQAELSIDTWRSQVAERAVEHGVALVNDVTAGRGDPKMFSVLAPLSAKLVLMYAKDPTPRTMVRAVDYDDVIATVRTFLEERMQAAQEQGIAHGRIILDPGMGHFVSSSARYSFEILARLEELRDLTCPLLVSPSRKSFLALAENLPPAERLPGTIAASAIAVLHGAQYIRTHDVRAVKQACRVAEQILSECSEVTPLPRRPR
ncbi:dihydropteroate synthase [Candidatus Peregrinibacteria bacterium CG10_big_fil_rev_8_21_14_0_10_55_24]|nr:MAG: dihydropteroate synthase [Candidatus Peregrinibacteria bacterium CG10_big_fil_rev_8_21_14_0_10_55_24]